MKKLIIYVLGLLLFTPMSCQEKTKENKKMQEEQFSWSEGASAPLGYLVQIYKGSIGFKSLTDRLITGKYGWGTKGNGMNDRSDWMPRFLNVTWLSYAEDCMYTIETPIDHEKLFTLFKKGYETKVSSGSGEIRHETYDGICTGFAPGGIVVVWAVGSNRQTEIGRYQGKKIIISASEIANLDNHQHLLFDAKYKKGIMMSEDVIPKEVQKANKNKPIPFGLWDNYRIKYNWKSVFELQDDAVLDDVYEVRLSFLNGEVENIFSDKYPLKNMERNAIPRQIQFSFKDKNGIQYGAAADFNEESIFAAFKEVYGEDPENVSADLDIRHNITNDYFTIKLKGNGKDIFIKTENLEVFKRIQ